MIGAMCDPISYDSYFRLAIAGFGSQKAVSILSQPIVISVQFLFKRIILLLNFLFLTAQIGALNVPAASPISHIVENCTSLFMQKGSRSLIMVLFHIWRSAIRRGRVEFPVVESAH